MGWRFITPMLFAVREESIPGAASSRGLRKLILHAGRICKGLQMGRNLSDEPGQGFLPVGIRSSQRTPCGSVASEL